ncbi:hypothetical protein [Streptomyces sp. NPDC057381]|uniref:hypothetical protein n=1 Tax=Streptomyces sp. NPDC057381 TaxID=3346111 RepID=UPI00362F3E8C
METHSWNNLPLEWRRPGLADTTLASTAWYLLHVQPQVPESIAATAALVILRCVRFRNPTGGRR